MLVGEPVFGPDPGVPVRVDFQTGPDGWLLDDVLVTTAVGATRHRFALSLKSNRQFTAKSAPSDFVEAAWKQWLHLGTTTVFEARSDFMGLVTKPLSGASSLSLRGLIEKARVNDPAVLARRIGTPRWATRDQRGLFTSFACPAALGRPGKDEETGRLLKRLRFIQCDFGEAESQALNGALGLCRRAVRSHTLEDARQLWSTLREVASELRPLAGSLTLHDLVDRLRSRARLADYPDHAADWATLDARSARETELVRDSIADRIRLPRKVEVSALIDSLQEHDQVALLGPSGVGKSALAKAVFERRKADDHRTLWWDAAALDRAADFGAFEASLQLDHSLDELISQAAGREPLLVIDGLDRLYSAHAFRSVATLLKAARSEQPTTSWRVLAVCQSSEWRRILEGLTRAGSPVAGWSTQMAEAPDASALQPVLDAVPAVRRLLLAPRVGALLTNLKLLDLVVRRLADGTEIDASTWVGESSVAQWFWTAEIDRGPDRFARGRLVRGLAQEQADQLIATVPVDSFEPSSLDAAQTLTADQLLVDAPGDRLGFAHDLYGDWARLRILLNHRTDLVAFLNGRHESPLWHRAIRLLGIHLLEQAEGVDEWRTLMSSFEDGGMCIVRDLLLEAPAFAMNAGPLLDSILPDLATGDGGLLQRLLRRFMAFATLPDEKMTEVARRVGMDPHAARAAYRRPHWPYWLDVIAVLHAHREEALRAAAGDIARLVEMWLEFVPPGFVRRQEAAELAVLLGQEAVEARHVYGGRDDRERFYTCALLAAPERPDEVGKLAKTAAERVPRPDAKEVEPPREERPRSILGAGVLRGPWPDGPLDRVDDAFENVVLDRGTIRHLFGVRPSDATEVILATLIAAPYEEHLGSRRMDRLELELGGHRNWHPALFSRGPFLLCLHENFEEGLELIMRLTDFATERSNEWATREMNEWCRRAEADGLTESEIAEATQAAVPQHLVLHDGTRELRFIGDGGSYGWSAGVTCPQGYSPLPPPVLASALMALEKYFYQRLDEGQDISAEVASTLARYRSVAGLGVLMDVGKRQPGLFDGPLRALLSAPELYAWDISKTTQGRTHLMIGGLLHGRGFVEVAREFHGLQHRNRGLRHVATERLLGSAEMQAFFRKARDWWCQRRATGESLVKIAEQLDLWLDPANYEAFRDPTHGMVVVNVALQRIRSESLDALRELSDQMSVVTFPTRCRTILDQEQHQTDEQLEALWEEWSRVRELWQSGSVLPDDEERFGDPIADALMAGVAVFLSHTQWLAGDDARGRSIETAVEAFAESPPERNALVGEYDISTWTWDCFLAEAGALLWTRAPDDRRWRQLVGDMVLSSRYAGVRLLFSRCAEQRALLAEDFGRLRRLAVDWAHMRDRMEVLRTWEQQRHPGDAGERLREAVAAWADEALASFVDGTLEALTSDWNQFDDATRFAEIDAARRRWSANQRLLDFHLVRVSHEWLPLPDEASSPEERDMVIQFWQVALQVVTARPRANLQRRDHQYPHEDETWVLENVAAVVLQLRADENPEQLWTTIIDLHSEAHDWPEIFMRALHRHALTPEQMPASYGPLLRQIVAHAFSWVEGRKRWYWYEGVWDALLGIDGWMQDVWADRHADHIGSIWGVIRLWMDQVTQEGRRLAKFARWMSRPATSIVRLRTLPWFLEQLRPDGEHCPYPYEDAEDDVAGLLNVVWDHDRNRLRTTPEAFAAFRGLLAWLVERQNRHGLELQGRIGGLA